MTEITLEQAFHICQQNKNSWLSRKSELAEAEREYQELFATGNDSGARSLQMLRDIIDVKKWEVNQTAGRYIRAHEDMQHSIQYLREALVVWLARGEKINYSAQDSELLTAAGFRPDAASRADNREKYTPAQNQNYVNKCAELAAR